MDIDKALAGDPEAVAEVRKVRSSLAYGETIGEFVPTETFMAECFGSEYVAGQTYYIREAKDANGDTVVSPLQMAVEKWAAAGKVKGG